MKYRLVILAFVSSIAAFLLTSTSASSRDAGAQGGCFTTARLLKSPMQKMSDPGTDRALSQIQHCGSGELLYQGDGNRKDVVIGGHSNNRRRA